MLLQRPGCSSGAGNITQETSCVTGHQTGEAGANGVLGIRRHWGRAQVYAKQGPAQVFAFDRARISAVNLHPVEKVQLPLACTARNCGSSRTPMAHTLLVSSPSFAMQKDIGRPAASTPAKHQHV